MALSKLRSYGFWAIDSIKGKKIKNHYDEIALINEKFDSAEAKLLRTSYVSNLIEHATSTTPFYKGFSHLTELEDFPVIKKTTVQNNFEEFKSQPYIDLPKFKVATSGSTGIPFFLFQNENKKKRNKIFQRRK